MVTHTRHEGGICCEFLGQLSEKVPDGRTLPSTLAVHSCIGHVSGQEDQTEGSDEVVLGDFVDDEGSEGGKGAHITKDSDVHLLQSLVLQWRRGEVFNFGEGSCLTISYPIVISFQWIQIFHGGHVDPTLETSQFSYIVGMKSPICNALEQTRYSSILDNRKVVMFGVGDPDNLHLSLLRCEAQVDLFVSGVVSYFYPRYLDQFLKSNHPIAVGIEEIEDGLAN